ncbi:MAG: hypothetical protein IJ242_04310 [Clostridia bacterium]|nr:hypothetical protein [Clostridia bacterium]
MRYEQEILEKIMYYDREEIMSSFPLYIYRTKEMAQHFMLVCQIMTTAIDTVPKARLWH